MRHKALQAAIDRHRESLLAVPEVVGIGIGLSSTPGGTGEALIRVFVRTPQATEAVASAVRGILNDLPFEVVIEGPITALE